MLIAGCRSDPSEAADGTDGSTDGVDDGDDDGGSADDADDGGTDDGPDAEPSSVATPRATRLTDSQYRFTVQDILGVELTDEEVDALPQDIPTGRDYSTNSDTQAFSSQYVLAYAEVARSLSERIDLDALVADHGGCQTVSEDCRADVVAALGHRLYRRPLTDGETTRYVELADTIAERIETTEDDVVRGLLQAMLQAPQFLYVMQLETDGVPGALRRLDGYELASRLSYFLWQSAPDDTLLAFAAGPDADGVFDPDAVAEQVDRMIADDKFARARSLFWGDYTMAARSSFGTSDTMLAGELRDSILATVDRISGVGADPEPLSSLLDGSTLVMTPAVAELAGAEPSGDGLQVYDAADAEQRFGVVTHPAFLASIGTTSFVGRGLFLTERLLCQSVAAPPEDVAEDIMMTAQATEDMTPREASEFRFGLEPVCLGCHTQFEPIAYAFERYDILGRYAETDEDGRALYSDGLLPAFTDRPEIAFSDAAALLGALSGIDAPDACLVNNMTEFATGRVAFGAADFLPAATGAFLEGGSTFDELCRAVAQSEQRSLLRVVEP